MSLTLSHLLSNGGRVEERCLLSKEGVSLTARGTGSVSYQVPVFYFDGETYTEIRGDAREIQVYYKGYKCVYRTEGHFTGGETIFANRNGHYRLFEVQGEGEISLRIAIEEDVVWVK